MNVPTVSVLIILASALGVRPDTKLLSILVWLPLLGYIVGYGPWWSYLIGPVALVVGTVIGFLTIPLYVYEHEPSDDAQDEDLNGYR